LTCWLGAEFDRLENKFNWLERWY